MPDIHSNQTTMTNDPINPDNDEPIAPIHEPQPSPMSNDTDASQQTEASLTTQQLQSSDITEPATPDEKGMPQEIIDSPAPASGEVPSASSSDVTAEPSVSSMPAGDHQAAQTGADSTGATDEKRTVEDAAEGAADEAVVSGEDKPQKRRGRRQEPMMSAEDAQPLWDELHDSFENLNMIEVNCVRSIQGGIIISYKGLEGFIPKSHFLPETRVEQGDLNSFIGQNVPAIVIEMSDFDKRRFVCSRKKAIRHARFLEIHKGDLLEGVVRSVTNYGAFVDLGIVDGLVHVSRLSRIRVANPSDVVKVKDKVKVRVVDVDVKNERISLSMKEFSENPWTNVQEKYPVGSLVKGKVRNLTDYGVYVQLEPGIVGMIHISDLSWTRRLYHPHEAVRVGQEIEAKVIDIRSSDKRLSLSVKAMLPDPWPRLANIYHQGAESAGTVKRIMEAGAIVALDYDIDCFVPRGKIGGPRRGPRRGAGEPLSIKLGDVVQVKVIEMDTEKKSLVCSIVREEEYHGHEDSSRGGYNLKHTESDRAYTLGDIPALKNLFKNQGGEIPVEAAPETPTVTETPAAVETPVAAEIPVSAETPSVVETSAVAEAPPVVEIPGVAENSMADDSLNMSGDTIAGNVNPEVMNAGVEASAAAENIVQEQLKPDAADADPYEAAINTDNENFASVVESGVADAETPADGEPATDVSDSEPGTEIASKAGSDDEEATKS